MRSRVFFAFAVALAALTMSAGPAAAGGSGWHLGYYTPSGRALSDASTGTGAGIATFDFTNQPNTALLVTDQGNSALLGDDRGKTVSATFTISGATGAFTYFGEGDPTVNPCVYPANTRLFFQTSNAGGFDETHYWWSNPSSMVLANGTFTVTATVSGAGWSDFYGHFGSDPSYSAGFAAAAANVTSIGLSFGGGCFFENGVGTSDGSGIFTLTSFSVS